MSELTPRAIAQMRRDIARRIGTSTVVLRRSTTTLATQPGVVVLSGTETSERRDEASRSPQRRAQVWGLPDLDVQEGDRLTVGGVAFRVMFVQIDRTAGTIADLETQ